VWKIPQIHFLQGQTRQSKRYQHDEQNSRTTKNRTETPKKLVLWHMRAQNHVTSTQQANAASVKAQEHVMQILMP